MGKRKRSDKSNDIDSVLKEMKKLERKVKKMRKRRSSSSSQSDSCNLHSTDQNIEISGLTPDEVVCVEDNLDFNNECLQSEVILPESVAMDSAPELLLETSNTQSEDPIPPQFDPQEIVDLLGEDPSNKNSYGANIHRDIAPRWSHILVNGLSKDTKDELVKRYLLPENCPNMKAPKLNLEIKAALLETDVKRDLFSQYKQNQLASSLAAIGQVLNWTLDHKNIVPQDIIKTLSDAGRLICDSHYRESTTRRFAAVRTLNKDMKEMVNNTKIDEYLFGSALSEHIKSSKAISKTSSEIKQVQRPLYKTPTTITQRGALNSRGTTRAATVAPRSVPVPRLRPPPRNSQPAPRGLHSSSYSRQQTRRR